MSLAPPPNQHRAKRAAREGREAARRGMVTLPSDGSCGACPARATRAIPMASGHFKVGLCEACAVERERTGMCGSRVEAKSGTAFEGGRSCPPKIPWRGGR